MVGVVVEDVLVVGGVGRHVAVTRLHVVGVFGLVPLHGRTRGVPGTALRLGRCIQPSGTLWSPSSLMMVL